ncbi:MAG: hypothetical protein HQL95_16115, partial [Magnetococcales bacterium]|nr:hypothetical protein [Magnetococcales bacterium]
MSIQVMVRSFVCEDAMGSLPGSKQDRIIVLLLLLLVTAHVNLADYRGIKSPWVFMTGPWCRNNSDQLMIGYAKYYDDSFQSVHEDSTWLPNDTIMLLGVKQHFEISVKRAGTLLLSFLSVPYLSSMEAVRLLNKVIIVIASIFVYLLMRYLTILPGWSALFALLLISLGSFNFFISESDPHVMAAFFCLSSILLILYVQPWKSSIRSAEWWLVQGCVFYAVLVYKLNIAIQVALLLLMLPRWRAFVVSLFVLVSTLFYVDRFWPGMINWVYSSHYEYSRMEDSVFQAIMAKWTEDFRHGDWFGVMLDNTAMILVGEPSVIVCMLAIVLFFIFSPVKFFRTIREPRFVFLLLSAFLSLAQGVMLSRIHDVSRPYLLTVFNISIMLTSFLLLYTMYYKTKFITIV